MPDDRPAFRKGVTFTDRNLNRLLQNETYYYCLVILGFAVAELAQRNYIMGGALLLAAAVMLIFTLVLNRTRVRGIKQYVQQSVDLLSGDVMHAAPFPLLTVRLEDGEVLWHNKQLQQALGAKEQLIGSTLGQAIKDLPLTWLREGKLSPDTDLKLKDRRYQVLGYIPTVDGKRADFAVIELVDSTELFDTRDEFQRTRPVVSIILVDNYDELTNNCPDATVSAIVAQLQERITNWSVGVGGLLRRLERNRYLFLLESKELAAVEEKKFSLLDTIREVTSPSGVAATISMGLGKDGQGFQENYDYAMLALEMALSRGGDQAVIKDKYDFTFFGGRSQETERHTKVKARVMASSLAALIEQSSRVFVMGHRNADADAIGAAAGVCCLCRERNRKVNIVTDLNRNSAKKVIDMLRETPDYKDRFITPEDALLAADAKSLLVVVDTNRPDQVESKSLLESMTRVAVIDHHRRAADYIGNAALNLHEPFASSAAELVTEILMYAVDSSHIQQAELKALLAGIVLDTKNFNVRVSSRTFEAAAFLRRLGADTVAVKRLFQSDFGSTVARYQLIEHAKLYRNSIAISAVDGEVPRELAGQAADELLGIDGIDTSFVLFKQGDVVFISARSMDAMNVQVVLEPFGGGGNAATAGAQIRGKTITEVQQELISALDQYLTV